MWQMLGSLLDENRGIAVFLYQESKQPELFISMGVGTGGVTGSTRPSNN